MSVVPDQNFCPHSTDNTHTAFGKDPVTCYYCGRRLYGFIPMGVIGEGNG